MKTREFPVRNQWEGGFCAIRCIISVCAICFIFFKQEVSATVPTGGGVVILQSKQFHGWPLHVVLGDNNNAELMKNARYKNGDAQSEEWLLKIAEGKGRFFIINQKTGGYLKDLGENVVVAAYKAEKKRLSMLWEFWPSGFGDDYYYIKNVETNRYLRTTGRNYGDHGDYNALTVRYFGNENTSTVLTWKLVEVGTAPDNLKKEWNDPYKMASFVNKEFGGCLYNDPDNGNNVRIADGNKLSDSQCGGWEVKELGKDRLLVKDKKTGRYLCDVDGNAVTEEAGQVGRHVMVWKLSRYGNGTGYFLKNAGTERYLYAQNAVHQYSVRTAAFAEEERIKDAGRLAWEMKETNDISEPVIKVEPSLISISINEGNKPSPQTFEVWNGGSGTLYYTVTEISSLFDARKSSGSSSGQKIKHTIDFKISDLTVEGSPYKEKIVVSSGNKSEEVEIIIHVDKSSNVRDGVSFTTLPSVSLNKEK